ncbi:MAG: hypothetical protein J0L94_01155 [Rhodothermia bacterium]|nr:hypothetical protein [Rhodothermia bacterium]
MAFLRDIGRRESDRAAQAFALLLSQSALFRTFENADGFQLAATDHILEPVDDTAATQGRALGGGFTRAALSRASRPTTTLAIQGDAVSLDVAYQRDIENGLLNMDAWLERRMNRRIRSWVRSLEAKYFNGNPGTTATDPKGFKTLLDGATALPGFAGNTGTIDATTVAGTNELDLTSSTNYDALLEAFEQWTVVNVPNASAIFCSPKTAARLTTIAHLKRILGEDRDQFGNPVKTFNGIAIVPTVPTAILHTEPNKNASATTSTSIYIARIGEGDTSLLTNGFDFWDHNEPIDENKISNGLTWEFRGQIAAESPDAIARVMYLKV